MRTTGRRRYSIELDAEGARWLANEALQAFQSTKDYAWQEIAETLESQLRLWDEWEDDSA